MARQSKEEREEARRKNDKGKGFVAAPTPTAPIVAAQPKENTAATDAKPAHRSRRESQENYYQQDSQRNEELIKRIEAMAPYKEFTTYGLEPIENIIARFREKGSLYDLQTLSRIAYGGHCIMRSADRSRSFVVDIAFSQKYGLRVEAREAFYDHERKMFLPVGQRDKKAVVNYLFVKLQDRLKAAEAAVGKMKDSPAKIEQQRKLNDMQVQIDSLEKKIVGVSQDNSTTVFSIKQLKARTNRWNNLVAEIGEALGLDSEEIKAFQNSRDNYKKAIYVSLKPLIEKACGRNGHKSLDEYVNEYLEKGYIDDNFFAGGINNYAKELMKDGTLTEAEVRNTPIASTAMFVRSSVDGMPIPVRTSDCWRNIYERFIDENGEKKVSKTGEVIVNTFRDNDQVYHISDDELKSLAYGSLVTIVSDKGQSLTVIFDAFREKIVPVEMVGRCLRAAHEAELAETREVSHELEEDATADKTEGLAEEVSSEESADMGIGE